MISIVGFLAGILTTGCFFPQVIKTYRTKSIGDFSFMYLISLASGILLWTIYGILQNDVLIFTANAVSLVLVSYLLLTKVLTARCAKALED